MRTLCLYRQRDLQDMFNEKSKVQISGYDALPFCKKEERSELMCTSYCVCVKYHWKKQKKPIQVVTYRREGQSGWEIETEG